MNNIHLVCCRSPVTVRKPKEKQSSSSGSSPEKIPPSPKLPPRYPRRTLSRRSSSTKQTSSSTSRPSSSSPEKIHISGQDDFISRVKSRSPSPVRILAPQPESPSHSLLYSSNFGSSSSANSSPSKSPMKIEIKASPDVNLKDTNKSAQYESDVSSIHTDEEIQVEQPSEGKVLSNA